MLLEPQQREPTLFDSDPAYNNLATVFTPTADATTHTRHLAAVPPKNRASRGAVVSVFALVAMLAGLGGLTISRYVVTAVPTSPTPMPVVAKPPPAPAPKPTPVAAPRAPAPPPIRLALSRPPNLPPIAPRPQARKLTPPTPALADASRWQRTPHLTGTALTRALAQDVIDTRKLNVGVLSDTPPTSPDAAQATRPR